MQQPRRREPRGRVAHYREELSNPNDRRGPQDLRNSLPVYGFITLNDWEWQIISQPAFQGLRRIRQLAWTDHVFPGAMHTRFEHSLGVMHMATMLYDGIVARSGDVLASELGYNDDGLHRHKALVRLAALLHDVGHGPFSHAAEELLPFRNERDRYKHEQYSAEIVRRHFSDVIRNHPLNTNYGFSADDVASLLEGKPEAGKALFWRDLIASWIQTGWTISCATPSIAA